MKTILLVILNAVSNLPDPGEISMTAKFVMPDRKACEAAVRQIENRAGPIAQAIGTGVKIRVEKAECSEA